MIEFDNFWFVLGLTLFAGLSTGIEGARAYFTRRTDTKFLSVALGFSSGVRVFISLNELLTTTQNMATAPGG